MRKSVVCGYCDFDTELLAGEDGVERIVHDLKVAPEFYYKLVNGSKRFEIRKHDRDFQVNDLLRLNEFKDGNFTENHLILAVTYLLTHEDFPVGIPEGYCVMSLTSWW